MTIIGRYFNNQTNSSEIFANAEKAYQEGIDHFIDETDDNYDEDIQYAIDGDINQSNAGNQAQSDDHSADYQPGIHTFRHRCLKINKIKKTHFFLKKHLHIVIGTRLYKTAQSFVEMAQFCNRRLMLLNDKATNDKVKLCCAFFEGSKFVIF